MAAKPLTTNPLKLSKQIVIWALVLITIVAGAPKIGGWIEALKASQVEKRLRREIARAQQAVQRPAPVRQVHEFILNPGERRVIETGGNRFQMTFFHTTHVGFYRGKYAKESVLFRNGSHERTITQGVMRDTQALEFIRPAGLPPTGYKVVVWVPQT